MTVQCILIILNLYSVLKFNVIESQRKRPQVRLMNIVENFNIL